MTKILDRILNNLKIEDYIQIDHVTGFCEKYDPVSLCFIGINLCQAKCFIDNSYSRNGMEGAIMIRV